jgi:thiol-disulfide isomerase/thioredoxin
MCALTGLVVVISQACAQDNSAPVELKTVKLNELKTAIAAHKGKVVVIDFWGTLCIPCMREFHNLVNLHHKYGDKGVVCLSVSVDVPESKGKALEFLKKKKAVLTNFILDDEDRKWQNEWKIDAIPAVMVYDSAGKLYPFTNTADKQFKYAEVETLVQKLIAK